MKKYYHGQIKPTGLGSLTLYSYFPIYLYFNYLAREFVCYLWTGKDASELLFLV